MHFLKRSLKQELELQIGTKSNPFEVYRNRFVIGEMFPEGLIPMEKIQDFIPQILKYQSLYFYVGGGKIGRCTGIVWDLSSQLAYSKEDVKKFLAELTGIVPFEDYPNSFSYEEYYVIRFFFDPKNTDQLIRMGFFKSRMALDFFQNFIPK